MRPPIDDAATRSFGPARIIATPIRSRHRWGRIRRPSSSARHRRSDRQCRAFAARFAATRGRRAGRAPCLREGRHSWGAGNLYRGCNGRTLLLTWLRLHRVLPDPWRASRAFDAPAQRPGSSAKIRCVRTDARRRLISPHILARRRQDHPATRAMQVERLVAVAQQIAPRHSSFCTLPAPTSCCSARNTRLGADAVRCPAIAPPVPGAAERTGRLREQRHDPLGRSQRRAAPGPWRWPAMRSRPLPICAAARQRLPAIVTGASCGALGEEEHRRGHQANPAPPGASISGWSWRR